jgi:folate-dependent phosphoribosylglycinamide formyltransferase PurN
VPVAERHRRAASARILEAEHRIYPRAVRLVIEGRYEREGRRVRAVAGA